MLKLRLLSKYKRPASSISFQARNPISEANFSDKVYVRIAELTDISLDDLKPIRVDIDPNDPIWKLVDGAYTADTHTFKIGPYLKEKYIPMAEGHEKLHGVYHLFNKSCNISLLKREMLASLNEIPKDFVMELIEESRFKLFSYATLTSRDITPPTFNFGHRLYNDLKCFFYDNAKCNFIVWQIKRAAKKYGVDSYIALMASGSPGFLQQLRNLKKEGIFTDAGFTDKGKIWIKSFRVKILEFLEKAKEERLKQNIST